MTAIPEKFDDTRTIITREPAYITHAFGKTVDNPKPAKGINQLLLSDGSTLFECEEGDYTHEEIQLVVRHRSRHAPSSRKYKPEVIDRLMSIRAEERARGIRGSSERTAERLNVERVPTTGGLKWYASTVDSVARNHQGWQPSTANGHHDPFKAIDAIMAERPAKTAPSPAVSGEVERTVEGALEEIIGLLAWISNRAEKACQHDDYDELKAKAGMFDQMRIFMVEGGKP